MMRPSNHAVLCDMGVNSNCSPRDLVERDIVERDIVERTWRVDGDPRERGRNGRNNGSEEAGGKEGLR